MNALKGDRIDRVGRGRNQACRVGRAHSWTVLLWDTVLLILCEILCDTVYCDRVLMWHTVPQTYCDIQCSCDIRCSCDVQCYCAPATVWNIECVTQCAVPVCHVKPHCFSSYSTVWLLCAHTGICFNRNVQLNPRALLIHQLPSSKDWSTRFHWLSRPAASNQCQQFV